LNEFGDFVGGIAAIFSIILLYFTLNHQDRSFKQDRFETTFFNLLGNQRELTESLSLASCSLNQNYEEEQLSLKGRECFQFAISEIGRIYGVLKSDKYVGCYEKDDDETLSYKTDPDYNENLTEYKIQEVRRWYYCRFYNAEYNITRETYDKCAAKFKASCDADVLKMCFWLFSEKNRLYFEHYERSLAQTLMYVCENNYGRKHIKEYTRFVVSQMSQMELTFVQYHSYICNPFRELFEKSGMSDMLKPTSK